VQTSAEAEHTTRFFHTGISCQQLSLTACSAYA